MKPGTMFAFAVAAGPGRTAPAQGIAFFSIGTGGTHGPMAG
ncbi:hypothetical protein ATH84_10342 [Paracoccus versutus]|uniref:Uncharacterized protein n=1 Tax=Paracoccus versutus TaxID=34007 RepID=A0AAQ0HEJ4_PARVE|nr:hypothetical protein [Paracoccus versutus]REG36537.1 hypothetical protein ATH84_10342 [Paracoccus versutus]